MRRKLHLAALAVCATLVLGGCATSRYVTSDVTTFQDWRSTSAEKTYAFAPQDGDNLETRNYEQLVAEELSPHGFRVSDRARASYLVSISYGVRDTTVMQPQFVPNYPLGPGWGPWGPRRYGWGGWGPWPNTVIDTPYPATDAFLTVRITHKDDGRELYRVTARHIGTDRNLPRVMPYLVRSALADFPMQNGSVRQVRVPRDLAAEGGAGNRLIAPAPEAPPRAD